MRSGIWESDKGFIYVAHDGIEMQFANIDEFLEVLLVWQEYVLRRKVTSGPIPDEFWEVLGEECRN